MELLKNRYKIEKELGRGGVGVVYYATDNRLHRDVAIKALLSSKVSPQLIERFRFEAMVTANLRHPNIVQVYEIIETKTLPIYIMEYVKGVRLDKYIKQRGNQIKDIISLMIPICKAVGFAHSKGIIHRDLKPANIMITPEGEPKIMDFGLAKSLLEQDEEENRKSYNTVDGSILGSPYFMSPEQARADMSKIDTRSDIYSIGAMLYTLLTNQYPFNGKTYIDVITQLLNTEPTLPTKIRQDISLDIEGVCMKAMEKDPEQRYRTTYELADDLRNVLKGQPVSARRYTFKERTLRAIKNQKKLFFGSIALVWLMFAGVSLSLDMLYNFSKSTIVEEVRLKLKGLAATTALMMDGDIIETVQTNEDVYRPEVKNIIGHLRDVQLNNERITFVYVMRLSEKEKSATEFVIEHDYLDQGPDPDKNKNGKMDDTEMKTYVGKVYEDAQLFPELINAFKLNKPTADTDIEISDEWEACLSGYAPIANAQGKVVAIVGLDLKSSEVLESFRKIDRAFYFSVAIFFVLTIALNVVIFLWIIGHWKTQEPSL